MVFPLIPVIGALAGTAANAIGSVMQGQQDAANQEAAIRARNEAVRQELKRQQKFNRKAANVFTDSLGVYAPDAIDNRMAKAGATVGNAVSGNIPTDFGTIGTMLAPGAMQQDAATFAGRGAAEGQQFGDSLGAILTRDQWLAENARTLAKKAHKLGLISDFAKGSARTNLIEQEVAGPNSQEAPSMWGPILQAGGTIGSYLAGRGGVPNPFQGGAPAASRVPNPNLRP